MPQEGLWLPCWKGGTDSPEGCYSCSGEAPSALRECSVSNWVAEFSVRRTGRTVRMLAEAEKLSREGIAVYVVAGHGKHAAILRGLLEPGSRVKIETSGGLGNLCWASMRLIGAHPNCVVLVDHYAIEQRFAPMLEMLHRFDEPLDSSSGDA